jgi:DNA-binding NarL/FixJ family response regulator
MEGKQVNEPIRVIIADDHPHEVAGIADLLEFAEGIKVIGKAQTSQEAVKLTLDLKPDVILIDILWYKNSDAGLEAIQQIRSGAPQTRILAMTAYDDLIELARVAGAHLVIHKDYLNSKQALVNQIRAAYESRVFPKPVEQTNKLSPRELEVLTLMVEGLTDKAIAEHLFLSKTTIKKYDQKIFGKLGVSNRTEAVSYALRKGLIRTGDQS